jgi:hypothetical protein
LTEEKKKNSPQRAQRSQRREKLLFILCDLCGRFFIPSSFILKQETPPLRAGYFQKTGGEGFEAPPQPKQSQALRPGFTSLY